jgi:hypothetical protein
VLSKNKQCCLSLIALLYIYYDWFFMLFFNLISICKHYFLYKKIVWQHEHQASINYFITSPLIPQISKCSLSMKQFIPRYFLNAIFSTRFLEIRRNGNMKTYIDCVLKQFSVIAKIWQVSQ